MPTTNAAMSSVPTIAAGRVNRPTTSSAPTMISMTGRA